MKYCKKCLYPNTKPQLEFNDEGVCSACTNFNDKSNINWEEKRQELEEVLNGNVTSVIQLLEKFLAKIYQKHFINILASKLNQIMFFVH